MDFKIDLKQIFNDLFDGVYVVDRHRIIRYWNRGAERLSGYRSEEVLGRSCQDNLLTHVSEAGENLCRSGCPLSAAMDDGRPREEMVFMSHRDGHRIPVLVKATPLRNDKGQIIGAVEIFSDNTREWRIEGKVRELEKMALVDSLTELPNRRYLETQLESKLSEFQRYDWPFGVLFMDIDRFKAVNDTYGHDFGDRTLKMIAKTLSLSTRPHDVVGRWGGEEFLAVIPHVDPEVLHKIGERYRLMVMNSCLYHHGDAICFTISGGGAVIGPQDTAEKLVKRADEGLYKAKDSGRNMMIVT